MNTPETPQPEDQDPVAEVPSEPTPETDAESSVKNLMEALLGSLGNDGDEIKPIIVDPSDPESIEKGLAGLPQEIKDAISDMIHNQAEKVMKRMISESQQRLDQFADDIRKITDPAGMKCEHHEGEHHDPISRDRAIVSFIEWLAEGSDISRTSLATLLGVAVGRMSEYQDTILELELASQLSTS
jgi:hypothetical protein